jgi:osmoprotectant transport system substrate-binding protein
MRSLLPRRTLRLVPAVTTLAVAAAIAGCGSSETTTAEPGKLAQDASLEGASFTVGSKEFTEQLVLCQITSIALRSTGATVDEKCGLSGSNTTRAALDSGEIDMYWEYTGTSWINYLKETKPIGDPAKQYDAVAKRDLDEHGVKWLAPSPANNTYAIVVKADKAKELGVSSLSDYAELVRSDPSQATMCIASEFAGREDGWPGLEKTYGFKLADDHVATIAEGAIYNGVSKGEPCNFGEAAATDGRIPALDLVVLEDDKQFFPVYNPALTVRESVYEKNPALSKVMDPIARALTTPVLQELNTAVDIDGEDPTKVAEEWLQEQDFTGK